MILKGFKEKSNKKYINKCVNNRVVATNNDTIKRVGVLVDNKEFSDLEWINSLINELNVNQNNIKILSLFNNKKEETSVYNNTFSEKELGWKGHFKSQVVKDFVSTQFDLLINFYETNTLALQVASATTNAQLKVGINNANQKINDLIIETTIKDKAIFKSELIKYLNILNKISNE
ncbi:hypothetical protein [Olleya sp. YS]|uniref:DUF6913 domain-containing protein n=1 Tax=Olleya sp. YS TaxID=3028318 RepID=UPI0024343812|nr:hypothetical protein [Olleya sp. YS]WGD34800.1 hypothetical protein Ollyesu_13540 [Olleya sp. YS]